MSIGIHTIRDDATGTAYMTRLWIGRLRLHIFHRGDTDPDCHDHPWDFWTFPLTPYVEEVAEQHPDGRWRKRCQAVDALRWHFRPAEHSHRVLGRLMRGFWMLPDEVRPGRIVTIVWISKPRRKWGFLKIRGRQSCWVPWREYIHGDAKDAPCGPGEPAA